MIKRCVAVSLLISVFAWCGVMAQDKLYSNEFPLGDVTLLDGPFKKAMDLNTAHLLKYTLGKLLFAYRKDAGLSTAGFSDYQSWDGLNGHVAGHYVSAVAMQYAATGDAKCKERMDSMVTELKKCQDANGNVANFTGYVSGIPNGKSIWNRVKGGDVGAVWDAGTWVPWYNIHKTYAGLRDAWLYGNNETAKTMFLKLCDWGINLCSGLSDAQIQQMLGNEHGGINEMYADAYQMTNDAKYLTFSKRMSHNDILNAMSASNDNLDGKHANTQCAKVVGFQRTGEVGKDTKFNSAADFFWSTVSTNRSIVIGANSEDEIFRSKAQCMEYLTDRNGVETCNSYNMLKLTEGLFRMKPNAKYMDFYERNLYNHILSTQDPKTGGYVYFTPTHPRHWRNYSAPDVCMWCCVGSGMENHTKYGQYIYTHTAANDSLFVNLFIASQLNWKAKGVTIKQETRFPDEEQTTLTVSVAAPTAFKMYIRHPHWAKTGEMVVTVGGQSYGAQSQPTSYIEINRTWNDGDIVTVSLPMHFAYEQLINVANWYALKRGPIILAAKTDSSTASMPGMIGTAERYCHSPGGTLMDYNTAPKLTLNTYNLDSYFKPTAEPFVYKAPGIFQNKADTNLLLRPFFRLHRARYMMYWNATTYTSISDAAQQKEGYGLGFSQIKGAKKFSFATADPSRRIILYTLAGKRIADIPASSRIVTMDYAKLGFTMKTGIYTVRIHSREKQVSKTVFITN
ncbi:MAG: glycoside hydrolase family 127 protein [Chitinispirillaceae bacterium]|nr:glycoside hydrolase family 127 protein [Chitinispirillaceae bacterium]